MNYEVRDGILLRNICGEWLLIAVGEASKHCLYVRQINDTLAWYWQRIAKGSNTKEIIDEAEACFDAPRKQIEKDLKDLMIQLCAMGYLADVSRIPESTE